MSTNKRLRGHKLQRLRHLWFQENPLCVICDEQGIIRAAVELDHIVPVSKGGTDEPENLQGLCSECHSLKTANDLGYKNRQKIGLDGWPIETGLKTVENTAFSRRY